jgi:citrate lyase subunit beta / citryl-CoA lyase
MRRSLLFIPASNPAMIQNADIFDADGIIFDLEDSVQMSQKDAARDLLSAFLKETKMNNTEILVRINNIDLNSIKLDIETVFTKKLNTIVLPKASVDSIYFLDQCLAVLEKKHHIDHKIHILPIIETASALLDLQNIAKCPRVDGLLLGAEDLATDLEIERTLSGLEILYARSQIVVVAKANQIDAIDTPFIDTTNMAGLASDALMAKRLGMQAKLAIHPNQIELINETFSMSKAEIDNAKKIIEAFNKYQKGVFSLDGKMIDEPIIERARKYY